MEIILLERVSKLGGIGDIVNVKNGYARNFLIPNAKAMRATAEAKKKFEAERARIEKENAERRVVAEKDAEGLTGVSVTIIRQAGESRQLYGSVTSRDIAAALGKKGFNISRQQVQIPVLIKELGVYQANVVLHPEVIVPVHVNVALSENEAAMQMQAFLKEEGKSYGSEKTSEENEE